MSKTRARETSLGMLSHMVDTTWDHLHTGSPPSCVYATATLLSHIATEVRSDVMRHFQAEALKSWQPPRHSLSCVAMILEGPSGEGAVTRWRKPKSRGNPSSTSQPVLAHSISVCMKKK